MPSIFAYTPPTGEKRKHQTEKPLALMRELVRICEAGGTILDPFAGSGSTLVAAIMEGYNVVGVEKDDYYAQIAQTQLLDAIKARFLMGGG